MKKKGVADVGAKEYLGQVRQINLFSVAMHEEIQELRALAENATNKKYSKMCKNGRVADSDIAEISSYEDRYIERLTKMYNLKHRIEEQITVLDSYDHKLLLVLRYLRHKTFEEVAEDMGYSIQWVHRLHKRALAEFEEKNELTKQDNNYPCL